MGEVRVNVGNVLPWVGGWRRNIPIIALPVTLWPYYPGISHLAALGGPRSAGHQHGLAARRCMLRGDSPPGSRGRFTVGGSLSHTSGS